jgi:hypothetical protein
VCCHTFCMGEEEGCGATRLVWGRRVWRHTPYMGKKGVAPHALYGEEGCGATRLIWGKRVWRHTPCMGEKGVAPLPMVSIRDLVQSVSGHLYIAGRLAGACREGGVADANCLHQQVFNLRAWHFPPPPAPPPQLSHTAFSRPSPALLLI